MKSPFNPKQGLFKDVMEDMIGASYSNFISDENVPLAPLESALSIDAPENGYGSVITMGESLELLTVYPLGMIKRAEITA